MTITVFGLDAGTSNYTSLCVVEGEGWNVHCRTIKAVGSIAGPQIEDILVQYYNRYKPKLVVMEFNGPGSTLAPYFERNQPQIPLATVDVAIPLPEDYELTLWDDLRIDSKFALNIRAAMYWIVRCLFRDEKIKIWFDDEELEVQLGTLRWDNDTQRGDKMYMVNKKKLKFKSSELDSEPFSKSPDKADSLALACLGYAILMQQELGADGEFGEDVDGEEIIDPITAGYFQLDQITEEAVE